jgi:hypothetical protein
MFSRLLRGIARHRVLFTGGGVLVELATLSMPTSASATFAAIAACIVLHVIIGVLTGIAFWENTICLGAVAALLVAPADPETFGWSGAFAFASALVASLAVGVWRPALLAWWDSPLCGRTLIIVHAADGKAYTVYNDFLCPMEREYGRQYGLFHVPEPIVYGHLGIVRSYATVRALEASRGDADALATIADTAGRRHGDVRQATEHLDALKDLFTATNGGARKQVLPRGLRWLKAPGGQLYYAGHGEPYRRQAPVMSVEIRFFERHLDPTTFAYRSVRDECLVRTQLAGETHGSDR